MTESTTQEIRQNARQWVSLLADHQLSTGVHVRDLADSQNAKGNCWRASDALCALLDDLEAPYDSWEVTGVMGAKNSHYGLLITQGETKTVVDLTARQLDPTFSFPLVLTQRHWHQLIQYRVGEPLSVVEG